MLRLINSRKRSLLGLGGDPVPCVQCDRREPGLAWGEFCSVCWEARERRANRLGQRWAVVAALVMAGWVVWKTPPTLQQRLFGGAAILLAYFVVRRLVSRTLLEYLPKEPKK